MLLVTNDQVELMSMHRIFLQTIVATLFSRKLYSSVHKNLKLYYLGTPNSTKDKLRLRKLTNICRCTFQDIPPNFSNGEM